jgi:hypothetical protein
MQYTINEIRRKIFKEVYQVYEVFQNFFGEDSVDLQGLPSDDDISHVLFWNEVPQSEDGGCNITEEALSSLSLPAYNPFILVYWPRVKVTNENDKSIIIQDLYAKIELDTKGNIPTENRGFRLNRATYPMDQWVCSYLHSHIQQIPKGRFEHFELPCLGTGPIKNTINSLRAHISEGFDEIRWMLFCEELSRYVTVESLEGVPYNRLENVHASTILSEFTGYNSKYGTSLYAFQEAFSPEILKDFILYYLQNGNLAINYQTGVFNIGMSYFDYMIDISNSFIEYFNTHFKDKTLVNTCFSRRILYHVKVANGKFFRADISESDSNASNYVGSKICTFKGKDITLKIIDAQMTEPQITTVICHGLAMYILDNILKIINYRYTNEHTKQHCGDNTAALPTPTNQRVYYI